MDMHHELYWNYVSYGILKRHGPIWTNNQIEYLSSISKNIEIIEETLNENNSGD